MGGIISLEGLRALDLSSLILVAPPLLVFWHVIPWVWDTYGIRGIPGPFIAKFSYIWLGLAAKSGHRSEIVHELHLKHGPFVRLAPNHVSIADPEALAVVYSYGNTPLKAPFYDAFVAGTRSLFSTRDRAEHTRKRKIIAHVFSPKSVIEFEPHLRLHINMLVKQWDRLYEAALTGTSGTEGEGWHGAGGSLWLDLLPWANYLAYDTVGDLAFGAPFGMISAARDMAQFPKDQTSGLNAYSDKGAKVDSFEIPAVKLINRRAKYSAAIGVLPGYWRPFVRLIPWYKRGSVDHKALPGIAIMAVVKRLHSPPTDRVDLLSKLLEGCDSNGNRMGRQELTAEALSLLIAGSDSIAGSMSVILYHLARNVRVQRKLQAFLDEHLSSEDLTIAIADQVKRLPYLDACINEAMRIYPTTAVGLPRVVPEGGLNICGKYFSEGLTVSVPSFTIHRDKRVWGEDVETYRPERWEEGDQKLKQSTFNPFSIGPRACIGRHLAMLELQIIVASLLRRYEFTLENPNEELKTKEWFALGPVECKVGIRRRDL